MPILTDVSSVAALPETRPLFVQSKSMRKLSGWLEELRKTVLLFFEQQFRLWEGQRAMLTKRSRSGSHIQQGGAGTVKLTAFITFLYHFYRLNLWV